MDFQPVKCAVLTVSDTRTLQTDKSGAYVEEVLTAAGHTVLVREILPDDQTQLTQKFESFIQSPEIQVVISTGGTGITRRDVTPEALSPLISKPIDGFGELFRALSYEEIGAATIQSRVLGALCSSAAGHSTLVFALPGSTGAVRLGMDKILIPQLDARTKPCNFVMLFDRL